MSPAIQIDGLGKKYRRGEVQTLSINFRETLMHIAKAVFSRIVPFCPSNSQFSILNSQSNDSSEFWALQDINLEVPEGEILGIIGRNGAGKSTFLKILSRIVLPTCGSIRYRGRMASLLEVGTGFHRELTGRENVYLNGAILGMRRSEITSKFGEIVEFAGISEHMDTPVKFYSSGMYIRLAFAVAAHLDPNILIVDEVLAVGDGNFQKKCLGKMGEVAKGGRTILLVSHNMFAISSLCGRAIWLDQGRIRKEGPARDVVQEYEDSQVRHLSDVSHSVERNPGEFPNGQFHISTAAMMNGQGGPETVFQYHDIIQLLVGLSGSLEEAKFSMEFMIFDESGKRVATGASGPYHDLYFDRNVKKISIRIGPLALASGRYRISLSGVADRRRVDTWENAMAFTITTCRPFKTDWNMVASGEGAFIMPQSFSNAD